MAYGTDDGLIEYLAMTGRVLPDGAVPAQVRYMGSMWVDSLEGLFCGMAVTDVASFPRDAWPAVPSRVEYAAYEAGYMWATGVDIFGQGGTQGGQVIKEKVDVLEVQYAEPTGAWWDNNRFYVPMAWAQLQPYLCLPIDGDGVCAGGSAAFVV